MLCSKRIWKPISPVGSYGLFDRQCDIQGAFGWRKRGNLWFFGFEAARAKTRANLYAGRCATSCEPRQVFGSRDKGHQHSAWQHDQSVTHTGARRVFLAGDVAPLSCRMRLRMNSGIQDSQNLVWKLIARLRWKAGDRCSIPMKLSANRSRSANGDQCVLNTKRMAETGWLLKDGRALAAIETPEGSPFDKDQQRIPKQREQFFSQGQQFGQLYDSNAVVDDAPQSKNPRFDLSANGASWGARTAFLAG